MLRCNNCKHFYHSQCLNIPTAYYPDQQVRLNNTWFCPACDKQTNFSKDPPTTPCNTVESNGKQIQHDHIVTSNTGNQTNEDIINPQILNLETITFEQLGQLLDTKLDKKFDLIKNYITFEIKSTVQTEVPSVLNEFTELNVIHQEQINIKSNMETLIKKLNKLKFKQIKLEMELKNNTQYENNEKKIVIYDLDDIYMETESELERMIVYAFQNTLNINIKSYIEKLYRLGKRGSRKPVYVEFSTKRLTKYILENFKHLQKQGLHVSKYFDEDSLEKKGKIWMK